MTMLRRFRRWLARARKKERLYARIEGPQLLEHEARERMLDLLRRAPGLSFHEVQDEVGLAPGTTQWHLDKLERSRFLASVRDGRHRRYYPTGMDPRTVRAVVALRDPSRLALARMVLRNPGITQADLARSSGLAQSTVSHHVSRMADDGLLRAAKEGRVVRYFVPDTMERSLSDAVGFAM